ncbi:MAG: hypothetical protein M0R48_10570, partial [Candidatus Omnitrophica bacterium]|nr:hypothetical protein [Candidatus Omnitrophota bacterium]
KNVPTRRTLEYPMTPSIAARFNLKAQRDMPSFLHHYGAGDITDRFESKTELRNLAITEYKKWFPDADVLICGLSCVVDPQECLDGPNWFKDESNRLWKAFQQVGGYEGNEKACDGFFLEYQKILKKLNDGIDKLEGL